MRIRLRPALESQFGALNDTAIFQHPRANSQRHFRRVLNLKERKKKYI